MPSAHTLGQEQRRPSLHACIHLTKYSNKPRLFKYCSSKSEKLGLSFNQVKIAYMSQAKRLTRYQFECIACQHKAKQFYILLSTQQIGICDTNQRQDTYLRGMKANNYVFATKECGLFRHEAANASGEMAMCQPAGPLEQHERIKP